MPLPNYFLSLGNPEMVFCTICSKSLTAKNKTLLLHQRMSINHRADSQRATVGFGSKKTIKGTEN